MSDVGKKIELTASLSEALCYLRMCGPTPMRDIARGTGISSQAMATRVWRLRQMGLAVKLGPELYDAIRESQEGTVTR